MERAGTSSTRPRAANASRTKGMLGSATIFIWRPCILPVILAFDDVADGEYPPAAFMFIAHGEWVRKHARWILGAILVLLIPGFVALFTTTGRSARGQSDLPPVGGKPVNVPQFEKARSAVVAQYIMNAGRQPQ